MRPSSARAPWRAQAARIGAAQRRRAEQDRGHAVRVIALQLAAHRDDVADVRARSRFPARAARTTRTAGSASPDLAALPWLSRMRPRPRRSSVGRGCRAASRPGFARPSSRSSTALPSCSASERSRKSGASRRCNAGETMNASAENTPRGEQVQRLSLQRRVDRLQRIAAAAGEVAQRAHAADLPRQNARRDAGVVHRIAHRAAQHRIAVFALQAARLLALDQVARDLEALARVGRAGRCPGRSAATPDRCRGSCPHRCRRRACGRRRCATRCAPARPSLRLAAPPCSRTRSPSSRRARALPGTACRPSRRAAAG